jgi:uncharacterized protein YyaL (SSP411 family)
LTAEEDSRKPNRLIDEKSPYLLQHAYNPVDWHPWCPEAFEKAAVDHKPVFLSIGYSTCHWCHVMERESFEDPEVAAAMNGAFVSIKVDREERPDIDATYMKVCQLVTGSGGWPLTIIMTPDKRPFFAGTYIPKRSQHGRTGMLELIPYIKRMWDEDRARITEITENIMETLTLPPVRRTRKLGEETLERAYLQLAERFDPRHGGFGNAPKFPTPHNLLFLLRHWKRTGEAGALNMVERTLRAIRRGGVYDHLGFGVHRYSTDVHWLVPHFEKMLYDQALLSMAYTEAYQATGDVLYRRVSEEILEYVLSEMTSPEGAFYSAEDADSEGEEGKFYVWTEDEMREALGDEADTIIRTFNVSREGNYTDESTRRKTGSNILHLRASPQEIATELEIYAEELEGRLEDARAKLLEARGKRVRPLRDDKVLLDWNGLTIAALAKAARAFDEARYGEAAERAMSYLQSELMTPEGGLLHRLREGEASIPGFLDDYAYLVWGLLELYEATFEPRHLRAALDLNRFLLDHFWDEERGGFFFTSDDAEEVLMRSKEAHDGARPSGNSVAALNTIRLGRITADQGLVGKAESLMEFFSERIAMAPASHTMMMAALDFLVGPSKEVIISGRREAEDTKTMLKAINRRFLPNKIVLFVPEGDPGEITEIAEYAKSYGSLDGRATAYVCSDYQCQLPTTSVEEMLTLLGTK